MTEVRARAVLTRFGTFLDQFTRCFGRHAHRTYASRYLQGLLNDSERKSMQPMHGRLSDPGSYQGLQHFITHSSWEVRPFWQRLRAQNKPGKVIVVACMHKLLTILNAMLKHRTTWAPSTPLAV